MHARERPTVCFLSSLPVNMRAFGRPELAEEQTARRRAALAVVEDVWLGELLPHGFAKRSWSKPSLVRKTKTPTPTPTHEHERS